MTPVELGLVAGLLLIAALVLAVLLRMRALTGPVPPDPRLDQLAARLDRLQETASSTAQNAVALAERTLQLAQAYKDLEALKERTDQLPKKIETMTSHTLLLPDSAKMLKGVDTKLEPLPKFMTDATKSFATVQEQMTPVAKTIPETAKEVHLVAERLKLLGKIDRQLEELHGVFRTTTGKGAIGEDAVRRVLAAFPDDAWIEKMDLPTGTVDFAVRTPNGLIVPIDSKTGGADDVRAFLDALARAEEARAAADEVAVQHADRDVAEAKRAMGERVKKSARDIQKYIVPEASTTPFVLQALPDAVFDTIDPKIRQEAAERGVLAVPYGLLHAMCSAVRRLETHSEIDMGRVSAALGRVRDAGRHIEDTVKNSIERASTMAANGAQEIRRDVGAIQAALLTVELVEAMPAP